MNDFPTNPVSKRKVQTESLLLSNPLLNLLIIESEKLDLQGDMIDLKLMFSQNKIVCWNDKTNFSLLVNWGQRKNVSHIYL